MKHTRKANIYCHSVSCLDEYYNKQQRRDMCGTFKLIYGYPM